MASLPGEIQREKQSIELDGSESTRVTLTMEAGELKVSGGAMTLMDAEFTYNLDRLKPVVEHRAGEIEISQHRDSRLRAG